MEASDIHALTIANIMTMKDEYLEFESMVDKVLGLIPVVVTELEPLKLSSFKNSIIK